MCNSKPFKTFDEQIDILRNRGLIIPDRDEARLVLMREGYYPVVNGYKDIFIDRVATRRDGDDRFLPGTSFSHLVVLFNFDRMLRRLTFSALMSAETTVKTAVVYSFCDKHRDRDAYLDATCYCGKGNYHAPGYYDANLVRMLGTLQAAHDNAWDQDCINHYLTNHGHVPLWVLVNTLTFGNISHFYSLQQRSVMNETCHIISEGQGVPRIKPDRLRSAVATLVDYRNLCAHEDRLYCARTGRRRDRTFADLLLALEVVTSDEDMASYVFGVSELIHLFDGLGDIQGKVINAMKVELVGGFIQPKEGWKRDFSSMLDALKS